MLDNVIDINYYPVPQAQNSNVKHRPVGLGVMGFQDALYKLNLSYNSEDAVEFADRSMELISYFAIEASSSLAQERGKYETYKNSLWDKGIFPLDSIELLSKQRGAEFLDQDTTTTLDWETLKEKVKKNGMRNSNVMAIAPTATIANITGVSQSIEPTYQNLFVKSNLSGEFTVVNPFLIQELKKEDLWDDVMLSDLKYYEGSLANINRVPEKIKDKFKTAFEVEPKFIVESASRRQKWIDQAQSLNLYIANVDGKKLDITYRMAWLKGLKTTYYLRSMGATSTEKSTVEKSNLNAVKKVDEKNIVSGSAPSACSILDPDCEACQ
jgi:ribonucleoside-diphosphate reductase alpha chain